MSAERSRTRSFSLQGTAPFPLQGTALVTGASAGLGEHFADFLARSGMDVVLTARNVEALQANAARITERHGRAVQVIPADLSSSTGRDELLAAVDALDEPISVLVNNAGFGTSGEFAEIDEERVEREVELNCVAVTRLARHFLPGMVARGHGAILNVSSAAAYQPIPTMAVYAATKTFVLSLSQALWAETRGSGVRVVGVCPGPTETAFFANTGEPDSMPWRRTPEQVVQSAFRALNRHQPSVVDGALNTAVAKISKVMPTRAVLPMARLYASPRRR